MCPDPFNEIVDMTAIMIVGVLILTTIKSYGQSEFFQITGILTLWISLIIFCYIFAPRHSVSTGIPYFYQSRYKKWKTGKSDWDTRIFRNEDKRGG